VNDAATLVESIDRHFAAGCPALTAVQLRQHQAFGVCQECEERAGALKAAVMVTT
jgi:hypothetical protein